MSKIAEAYRGLDDDAKKWYKASSDNAIARFKEEFGDDAMKLGPRSKKKVDAKKRKEQVAAKMLAGDGGGTDESEKFSNGGGSPTGDNILDTPAVPAFGLPDGWMKRTVTRWNKSFTYWFSPDKSYKFNTMNDVKRFLALLGETDGDEVSALKLYSRNWRTIDPTADVAEPAAGLPHGWKTRLVPRKDGEKSDRYWYSPEQAYRFPSMTKVKKFQEMLNKAGGNEVKAYERFTIHVKKRKSMDVVTTADDRGKKTKESKKIAVKKNEEDDEVGSKSDEEEKMPDAWVEAVPMMFT